MKNGHSSVQRTSQLPMCESNHLWHSTMMTQSSDQSSFSDHLPFNTPFSEPSVIEQYLLETNVIRKRAILTKPQRKLRFEGRSVETCGWCFAWCWWSSCRHPTACRSCSAQSTFNILHTYTVFPHKGYQSMCLHEIWSKETNAWNCALHARPFSLTKCTHSSQVDTSWCCPNHHTMLHSYYQQLQYMYTLQTCQFT